MMMTGCREFQRFPATEILPGSRLSGARDHHLARTQNGLRNGGPESSEEEGNDEVGEASSGFALGDDMLGTFFLGLRKTRSRESGTRSY